MACLRIGDKPLPEPITKQIHSNRLSPLIDLSFLSSLLYLSVQNFRILSSLRRAPCIVKTRSSIAPWLPTRPLPSTGSINMGQPSSTADRVKAKPSFKWPCWFQGNVTSSAGRTGQWTALCMPSGCLWPSACWKVRQAYIYGNASSHHWPFCVGTPLLSGGSLSQNASKAELWWFWWCEPEHTVEQTVDRPVIWDAMMLLWRRHNSLNF